MGGVAALTILAFAVSLNQDTYPLRSGCSPDDAVVAQIRSSDPVEIRYGRSGDGGTCYKVSVTANGRKVEGYLPASALSGLDEFEKGRRSAAATYQNEPARGPSGATVPVAGSAGPDHPGARTLLLLNEDRPTEALIAAESDLTQYPRDPRFLGLAGLASYRADHLDRALSYWKDSLEIQANPEIEGWYRKAMREAGGDRSSEKLYGTRFLLRYEGTSLAPEAAHAIQDLLEQEYNRIALQLGCGTPERISTIIQSPDAYRKSTNAAEWSGGQFDGKIRIPMAPGSTPGAETRRVVGHEIVHACLAQTGSWPTWLHEGLAQKLSGDRLSPSQKQKLTAAARAGALPELQKLGQDWSRRGSQEAALDYSLALAAIELFFEQHSGLEIRNVLKNPDWLQSIAANLDHDLREAH